MWSGLYRICKTHSGDKAPRARKPDCDVHRRFPNLIKDRTENFRTSHRSRVWAKRNKNQAAKQCDQASRECERQRDGPKKRQFSARTARKLSKRSNILKSRIPTPARPCGRQLRHLLTLSTIAVRQGEQKAEKTLIQLRRKAAQPRSCRIANDLQPRRSVRA